MLRRNLSRLSTLREIIGHRQHFGAYLKQLERDPAAAHRQHGTWYAGDVQRYTAMVAQVPGDFAEIGCYKGDTFSKLVPIAKAQGKSAHAFDSFEGMAEPGPLDWRPKGQFDVGGAAGFRELMTRHGLPASDYQLWPGFIPEGFNNAPADIRFSFVLIDVDNYEPTVESLAWVWPRLNVGGLLALDDFYPAHDAEASLAIKQFLRQQGDHHVVDLVNAQMTLRKLG